MDACIQHFYNSDEIVKICDKQYVVGMSSIRNPIRTFVVYNIWKRISDTFLKHMFLYKY